MNMQSIIYIYTLVYNNTSMDIIKYYAYYKKWEKDMDTTEV